MKTLTRATPTTGLITEKINPTEGIDECKTREEAPTKVDTKTPLIDISSIPPTSADTNDEYKPTADTAESNNAGHQPQQPQNNITPATTPSGASKNTPGQPTMQNVRESEKQMSPAVIQRKNTESESNMKSTGSITKSLKDLIFPPDPAVTVKSHNTPQPEVQLNKSKTTNEKHSSKETSKPLHTADGAESSIRPANWLTKRTHAATKRYKPVSEIPSLMSLNLQKRKYDEKSQKPTTVPPENDSKATDHKPPIKTANEIPSLMNLNLQQRKYDAKSQEPTTVSPENASKATDPKPPINATTNPLPPRPKVSAARIKAIFSTWKTGAEQPTAAERTEDTPKNDSKNDSRGDEVRDTQMYEDPDTTTYEEKEQSTEVRSNTLASETEAIQSTECTPSETYAALPEKISSRNEAPDTQMNEDPDTTAYEEKEQSTEVRSNTLASETEAIQSTECTPSETYAALPEKISSRNEAPECILTTMASELLPEFTPLPNRNLHISKPHGGARSKCGDPGKKKPASELSNTLPTRQFNAEYTSLPSIMNSPNSDMNESRGHE